MHRHGPWTRRHHTDRRPSTRRHADPHEPVPHSDLAPGHSTPSRRRFAPPAPTRTTDAAWSTYRSVMPDPGPPGNENRRETPTTGFGLTRGGGRTPGSVRSTGIPQPAGIRRRPRAFGRAAVLSELTGNRSRSTVRCCPLRVRRVPRPTGRRWSAAGLNMGAQRSNRGPRAHHRRRAVRRCGRRRRASRSVCGVSRPGSRSSTPI